MEPKMEPRQPRPTLTKHAPAWTDCMSTPLGELHFSSSFKDPKQITKKYIKTLQFKNNAPTKPHSSENTAKIKSVWCAGKKFSWPWVPSPKPLPKTLRDVGVVDAAKTA